MVDRYECICGHTFEQPGAIYNTGYDEVWHVCPSCGGDSYYLLDDGADVEYPWDADQSCANLRDIVNRYGHMIDARDD